MMYAQDYDETFVAYQSVATCPWPEVCGTGAVSVTHTYLLQPYTKNNLFTQCPDTKKNTRANATAERLWREGRLGYGMAWPIPGENAATNIPLKNTMAATEFPADHILIADALPSGSFGLSLYDAYGGTLAQITTPFDLRLDHGATTTYNYANAMRPEGRHNGLVTVGFCDGHTKAMPFERVYGVKEDVCKAGNRQACAAALLRSTTSPELWRMWQ